jgi:hypothetical protein
VRVRGPVSAKVDLIHFAGRRVASNPRVPCDTDEAIVNLANRGRHRRAVRAERIRRGENASHHSRVGCRCRAVPEVNRRCVVHASLRSTVGRHLEWPSARIVPWWTSVRGRDRSRRDSRHHVPRPGGQTRFAVLVWQGGRRDTTRIESLPRLFWAPELVVSRWNRREHRPREAVREAFDEREESLRPRASLPVAFWGLFARQH